MATKNIKSRKDEEVKHGYTPKGEEKKVWDQFLRRKRELLDSRKNIYGLDIDAQMRRWDTDYFRKEADIPASELDPDQKPVAINNAYGKVQSALAMLIDRNPRYVLSEKNPKYTANRALIRTLAEASFRNTNSLGQFKLSIFNAVRRGWFIGRTFHRKLVIDGKYPDGFNNRGQARYTMKKVTKVDDVAYMNFSNYNAWVDEQSKPEDFFSTRDWMWREVWHIDEARQTFPVKDFANMKHVAPGGDTGVNPSENTGEFSTTQSDKENMVELYFYENQYEDQFIVEINGVMVVWEPLPQHNKRLSCVYAPWHFRGDDTIYGIGIIEEMENDEKLVDRILNMTMRQLLLTIAPGGFYSGSEDFEEENMKLKPGVLRRAMNPKDITWLQIPEGNQKGLQTVGWIEGKQDDKTGITRTLEGSLEPTSDTSAFEVGITREAGLKRLRLPLKNLQYALDWEFQNRIALIQQVYSDFQVRQLATDEEIFEYLDSIQQDPDLFFIETDEFGEETFFTKEFREGQFNLEQDSEGKFIETERENFFQIKPEMLAYEGDVTTDVNSLLIQSDELEKTDTLRLSNLIVPLLAQPKELVAKPVQQLLVAFNKDPRKWLPQEWIDFLDGKEPAQGPGPMMDEVARPGRNVGAVPEGELNQGVSESNNMGSLFGKIRGAMNPSNQE